MPAAREQEPPVVEARTVEHDAAEPSADHRQTGAEPAAIVEQPGPLDREEIVPGLSGHQDRSVRASETPKASNRSAVEVPEPAGPSLEPEQDRSEGTRSGGAELDASAAVTTAVEPTAEATVEDPARETERSVDAAPSAPEQREAEETVQESAEVEHRQAAERERAAEAQERARQQEREYESPHHEQEMEMDMDGMDMGM
jgi:hypothetical protein